MHPLIFVEATGFEPTTSASRTQRSTKLSHASIPLLKYERQLLLPANVILQNQGRVVNRKYLCQLCANWRVRELVPGLLSLVPQALLPIRSPLFCSPVSACCHNIKYRKGHHPFFFRSVTIMTAATAPEEISIAVPTTVKVLVKPSASTIIPPKRLLMIEAAPLCTR